MTKYKAKPTVMMLEDGASMRFDSKLEMAYWQKLKIVGEEFIFHPACYFTLGGGAVYRPDFEIVAGLCDYIEVKGGRIRKSDGKKTTSESPMWKRTRKQLAERYPNLKLLIVYGRVDAKRGFVTEWTEWLNKENGAAK